MVRKVVQQSMNTTQQGTKTLQTLLQRQTAKTKNVQMAITNTYTWSVEMRTSIVTNLQQYLKDSSQ